MQKVLCTGVRPHHYNKHVAVDADGVIIAFGDDAAKVFTEAKSLQIEFVMSYVYPPNVTLILCAA